MKPFIAKPRRIRSTPAWQATLLGLFLFILPGFAGAETLVFIQGFLGDGEGWRDSGITRALQRAGWQDAGHLRLAGSEVHRDSAPESTIRRYYTIDLPTYARLSKQAQALDQYINYVRKQHPGSALVLVGHSAGGVLARLYMVQHSTEAFAALITIASPHLGIGSTDLGLEMGARMLAWMTRLIGDDTLDLGWGLLRDLKKQASRNLLGWLNHQPHPQALYISIVHQTGQRYNNLADLLVPAWSQDMNRVYALHGLAATTLIRGGHELRPADGRLLVRILERLRRV
jgi:triacylglycerol lipase